MALPHRGVGSNLVHRCMYNTIRHVECPVNGRDYTHQRRFDGSVEH